MCILPEYIFSNQKKKKIQKCKWSRIVKTIWEKKKVRDISLYHSTMALMRSLLARGVITPEEYGVIDTKMAEKYGLKSSVIFR